MRNSLGLQLHWPSLAISFSAVLWGTWWIPLRKLDSLGGGTIWLVALGVCSPALLFLPTFVLSGGRILRRGWPVLLCALFFGLSITFYAEGALRGNVARVILLFYLTPVWSTLLARLMLAEPITRERLVSIALGLTGLWIILGDQSGSLIPRPRDLAEWMGLLAGLFWALAMVYVQKNRGANIIEMAFPILFCYAVSFLLLTLIPGGRAWSTLPAIQWHEAIAWVVLIAVIWHIPTVLLSLYGAREVEPGRVAILLMLEVVIGVGSAAMLANEPFGVREIIGALFILSASLYEFVPGIFADKTNFKKL